MKLLILGSGTSTGMPEMGCSCAACTSDDPRDKRMRCSALLTTDNGSEILIDCGPDFRTQYLQYIKKIPTAIFITHEHFDHMYGLPELRPLQNATIYAEERVTQAIKSFLPYYFKNPYPGAPTLMLNNVDPQKTFTVNGETFTPIRIYHGKLPALGYRYKNLAYLTDVSMIEEKELQKLQGLKILIIDALKWTPHITHYSIPEALEIVEKLKPKRTYFTHIAHGTGEHAIAEKRLPKNVFLAYDGLEIKI